MRAPWPLWLFGAAAVASCAGEALAQEPFCSDRASIAAYLASDYAEAPVGRGLRDAAAMIEVYANPSTGTWTLLLVHADGTACVVAVGEDWHAVPYAVGKRS